MSKEGEGMKYILAKCIACIFFAVTSSVIGMEKDEIGNTYSDFLNAYNSLGKLYQYCLPEKMDEKNKSQSQLKLVSKYHNEILRRVKDRKKSLQKDSDSREYYIRPIQA